MSDTEVAYLTPAWGEALAESANASETFRAAAAGLDLAIGQEITDAETAEPSEGQAIRYTLRFSEGALEVEWGTVERADVVFVLSRDTADRMHEGALNAQQAFVLGKLRVRGNPERLLGAREVFLQLDDVFGDLRSRTRG